MSDTEIVEKLVDIIRRQADLMGELYSCVAQHAAATALESKMQELRKETDNLL